MSETLFNAVSTCSKELMKFGLTVEEFAALAQKNNMSDAEVLAVTKVFEYLKAKKDRSTVDFLLRTSRLPLKVPKTFDNFDFNRVTGKNVDKLRSLSTLSALYAHKNLAFIGKPGTGKTHLAQAFGRACCEHGMKANFIKMSELRDRMTDARRAGRESTLLASLVRPSCLIIDEVGHCEFDKENTRLFFDMVDRRYQKDGYYNMVFTSNRDPAQWQENFCENDSLLCALDRIFDDAIVFALRARASVAAVLRQSPCARPQQLLPTGRGTTPKTYIQTGAGYTISVRIGYFRPAEIGCFLPAQNGVFRPALTESYIVKIVKKSALFYTRRFVKQFPLCISGIPKRIYRIYHSSLCPDYLR